MMYLLTLEGGQEKLNFRCSLIGQPPQTAHKGGCTLWHQLKVLIISHHCFIV